MRHRASIHLGGPGPGPLPAGPAIPPAQARQSGSRGAHPRQPAPLWIAAYLPALSLEAFAATLPPRPPGAPERPLALLHGARLTGVDATAAALGLQPGQKRATAMALAPHTVFGQADPAREAGWLQAVAQAALVFSPSVTLGDARTVLLEVSTTQRAFGGLARLIERLQAEVAPLGLSVRWATAPTAGGAALLAHAGSALPLIGPHTHDLALLREQLDVLPLALLPAAQPHAEALQALGLHTLAALRTLPREGLARRFGPALLAELDAVRGEAPQAQVWIRWPERFEARLELFARADTAEQVLHGASLLLVRLVTWARGRRARVRRFALDMLHEPRHRHDDTTPARSTLDIALAEPSHETAHMLVLLRERLAQLPLPAPTLELQLRCADLAYSEAPSGELFPTRSTEREGLLRLLERLQARLGRERVQRVQRVADHRPERGTVLQPLDPAQAGEPARGDSPVSQAWKAHLTRPVWLFEPPVPLPDRESLPCLDGQPLQMVGGPERIETGWWDGDPAARDYFVAQAVDGSLVWVYRSRLPVTEPGQALWFLQGRFG